MPQPLERIESLEEVVAALLSNAKKEPFSPDQLSVEADTLRKQREATKAPTETVL